MAGPNPLMANKHDLMMRRRQVEVMVWGHVLWSAGGAEGVGTCAVVIRWS